MKKLEKKDIRDEQGKFLPGHSVSLKHGLYAYQARGELPTIPGKRQIQRRLDDLKDGLMKAVPDSEDPRRQVLIGQIVKLEGLLILIEEYLKRAGLLRSDRWRRGIAEIHPVGQQFVSFLNAQRDAIRALGLDRKPEPGQDLASIVAEIDRESAEKKAAEDAKAQGQGKETEESEKSDHERAGEEIPGGQGEGHE